MANKSFSRGKDVFGATASFAFIGNTEHSVPYMLKNTNLFDALPKAYYDTAFLDRVHLYLPGWEVSKLRNEMFTSGYGFIVDYLAEILKELRKDDFSAKLSDHVTLDSTLTTRDRDAIIKTFSGLMKIIYPHGEYTHEDALELINYAIEGRKRVKDQLIKMDDTFEEVSFSYKDIRLGQSGSVETLENLENDVITRVKGSDADDSSEPKPLELNSGQVIIRENQTGVSYDLLFAPYLKNSKKIHIEDPFIRLPYQMKLLLEFCSTLMNAKSDDEEIELHVVTYNDSEYTIQESSDNLDEIAESVFDMGIKMTFEMKPNLHDRFIQSDNGWKIVLGRGLDIFQKAEGRFSISDLRQDKRRCKACEITYLKNG